MKHPRLVLRFVDAEPGSIDGLYSQTDSIKINASHEHDFDKDWSHPNQTNPQPNIMKIKKRDAIPFDEKTRIIKQVQRSLSANLFISITKSWIRIDEGLKFGHLGLTSKRRM